MTTTAPQQAFDPTTGNATHQRPSGHDTAGLVLGAATVATGLMAGLYFAFSVAVMPGLARVDDRTFIDAMQQINVVIQNPVFFLVFFGAPALTAAAALTHRSLDRGSVGWRRVGRWTWLALAVFGIGLVCTMAVNVPLNDQLAAAGDPARIVDPAAVRHTFEQPWVIGNAVRTVASTVALGCLARALVLHRRVRSL